MKHTPLTILSVIALALVSCGSKEAEEEQPQSAEEAQQEYADEQNMDQEPETQTAGHGTYRLHAIEGAEIEFDLPTDPNHELLQDLESRSEERRVGKECGTRW